MVNLEGSNVNSSDQLNSTVSSLQGMMMVAHGSVPVNEYDGYVHIHGYYYGGGGPESQRKEKVGLRAYETLVKTC